MQYILNFLVQQIRVFRNFEIIRAIMFICAKYKEGRIDILIKVVYQNFLELLSLLCITMYFNDYILELHLTQQYLMKNLNNDFHCTVAKDWYFHPAPLSSLYSTFHFLYNRDTHCYILYYITQLFIIKFFNEVKKLLHNDASMFYPWKFNSLYYFCIQIFLYALLFYSWVLG